MSLDVTFNSTITIVETLAGNTQSAANAKRTVTHDAFNIAKTLNADTVQPGALQASFVLTLSGGAATIDLRALVGTNAAVIDGNGLKVQLVRIKNLASNVMTFYKGASTGHNAFSVDSGAGVGGQVVRPGGSFTIDGNDSGDDIDATHKTWDVLGTGSDQAEVTIVMG